MKKLKISLLEGDNLNVTEKLISENTIVNIIYIDPPYNSNSKMVSHHDIFMSNEESNLFSKESIAWIKYMKPRLENAYKLLGKYGIIAVSIGHEELGSTKILLDKIFGRENEIGALPRITNMVGKTTSTISLNHDFLLLYCKKKGIKFNGKSIHIDSYKGKDGFFETRGYYQLRRLDYNNFKYQKTLDFPVTIDGRKYYPGGEIKLWSERKKNTKYKDWCWIWNKERIEAAIKLGFIVVKNTFLYKKTYTHAKMDESNEIVYGFRTKQYSSLDFLEYQFSNSFGTKELKRIIGPNDFNFPKPSRLIETIIGLMPTKNITILDMFAGVGTTGIAAINKKVNCILIQNNEKIKTKNGSFKKIITLTDKNIKIALDNRDNKKLYSYYKEKVNEQ